MIAENKRTGQQVEFTLEAWRNMESTDHARNWIVINAGIVDKVEKVEFKQFSKPEVLNVNYSVNYRELLDEAGIKYNKNIKNQEKLKEIWEEANWGQIPK